MHVFPEGDVELRFDDNAPYLANTALETKPIVIHGNGPTKLILNSLGNYLPQAWNKEDHCILCWEDNLSFQDLKETPQARVALSTCILLPTSVHTVLYEFHFIMSLFASDT